MPHYLHLMIGTALFGGSTITELDIDNSGGSSKYRLLNFIRGEPRFKKQESDSPMTDGKRLMSFRFADVDEEIHMMIEASSTDDMLNQKAALDQYFIGAMDAQVARNNGGNTGRYYWIADKPKNLSTKTYKSEIIDGAVTLPRSYYDTNMLANIVGEENDPLIIRFTRRFYVSASTLTILNGVSATNGNGNYVDITDSGATAVTGDYAGPLGIKIVGGTSLTQRVVMGMCTRGTAANFKHWYWAKDATLTANTISLTGNYTVTNKVLTSNVATLDIGTHGHVAGDLVTVAGVDATFNGDYTLSAVGATTISYPKTASNVASTASGGTVTGEIDGNGIGNGTRTTAANTSENKTHRWVNSTNVPDQFHRVKVYGRFRSNTAGRYSARLKVVLTDGTNDKAPADELGGFLTTTQTIGTHSGNNWALVELGEFENPVIPSMGAALHAFAMELHTTCSNIAGTPTLDFDGFCFIPVGEGPNGTGFVQATFDFATAASGVAAASFSAIPGEPRATLLNGSDVATFPKMPDAGDPFYAMPAQAARIVMLLIDATNVRHNYKLPLTVTVKHELRHASGVGA